MKITRNTIPFRHIALYTLLSAGLTACGHSAPSESDARKAIEARIGDCEYIKVQDASKTNGTPIDDNDYRVEVKYTLKLNPTDGMKAQADKVKADFSKLADSKAAYDKAREDFKANEEAYAQAHQHDPDNSIATHDPADPTKVTYTVELGVNGAREQYDRQNSSGLNGGDMAQTYSEAEEIVRQDKIMLPYAQEISGACSGIGYKMLNEAFAKIHLPDGLTNGNETQWKETISMVKTDNGWQEAR
ncbi:hypothetical protein [Paraburkholderia sp. ZP32-5]|uniref:hypothetical protein n=1 Tax=Paraburkholderia sp. ZP32-5 TaxID=2883245 RepID=UPI001F3FC9F9|nr:hypothetical protein [Paraburkholderia sp. ZP32-5]